MEKIEIQVEPLRKHKLCICTPAYGGNININFAQSELALQALLLNCGIEHTFYKMGNESLITRGRNNLADMFMKSEYTDLLFIDGDIEFTAADVLGLLYFDKDFIGGNYPLKKINWGQVKAAVLKHPDISEEDLEKCGAQFTGHLFQGVTDVYPFTPIEVEEIATGFTLISKKVFEAISPLVDEYERAPNEPGFPSRVKDFFTVGVTGNRYESEDYSICRLWRQTGGKVFLCPWMALNHQGTHSFTGDLNRVIQLLGEIR